MADTKTKTEVRTRIAPKENLKEPKYYNVIYLNDDKTSMDFVIESLKIIFHYSEDSAYSLTMRIHEEGSAVVATLPYEIAEQKGVEVTLLARQHGFPLQVRIESEA
jgi:ATP-dependent Clp protease adaptor protein ClpS